MLVVRVEVGNQAVHVLEALTSVCVGEVAAHRNHELVSAVVFGHTENVVGEILHLLVGIECLEARVINERIVMVEVLSLVVPITIGPAVVVLHHGGENLLFFAKLLRERPPKHVH